MSDDKERLAKIAEHFPSSGRSGEPSFQNDANIVIVPDVAAVDLTASVQRYCCSEPNADFAGWDYYRGLDGQHIPGRGLRFESLVVPMKMIAPSLECVTYDEARAYFCDRGYLFDGNAGAFTQWLRQQPQPKGEYVAILPDNACWFDLESGRLCTALSFSQLIGKSLQLLSIQESWFASSTFVGFRLISTPSASSISGA